ncbi:MAG: peptidoglycan DD-metalloendopeptidase family protein [bacterium]|nr:peptidoglycan DD-metalloendopeptidase family protein [bacterium]
MNKEKVIMLGASVAVLGALTFTGVYLGTRGKDDTGEQRIDFSVLEDAAREQERQEQAQQAQQEQQNSAFADGFVEHDDMDVDPDLYAEYKQANSEEVVNPGLESVQNDAQEDGESESDEGENGAAEGISADSGEADSSDSMSYLSEEERQQADRETAAGMDQEAILQSKIETAAQTLQFDASQTLVWPVVGNVLINYSMDGYVYFTTLGQYRYSPAIVIAAAPGEYITSACDGIVSNVFYDEEIGNAVTVTLGSGYELTYGQLMDIAVERGDYIATGELIGVVAEPTKYYVLEGSNVYFAMTKDGEPVNPLTLLQ